MKTGRKLTALVIATALVLLLSPPCTAISEPKLLWEDNTGKPVISLSISADGQFLAAGTKGNLLFLDNSGRHLWSYPVTGIDDISINPDGTWIAVGGDELRLFNRTGGIVWKWDGGYFIKGVTASTDATELFAGPDNSSLIYFSIESGNSSVETLEEDLTSLDLTENGNYIAAGSEEGNVYLFDNKSRQRWKYNVGAKPVQSIAISSDGSRIVAGSMDDMIYVFSRNGRHLWSRQTDRASSVAITADGKLIASAGDEIHLYTEEGEPVWHKDTGTHVNAVSLSADGSLLAACDSDSIYLFSINDPEDTGVSEEVPTGTPAGEPSPEMTGTTPPPTQSGTFTAILMCISLVLLYAVQKRE